MFKNGSERRKKNNELEQKYVAKSLDDTKRIAIAFAKMVQPGAIVAFFGDLGAGKTTFIRSFVSAFSCDEELVNSPTFQYLNIYPSTPAIYHFDLYRLRSHDDFLAQGFDEYFDATHIVLLEWAEKIIPILPKKTTYVHIKHVDETTRYIEVKSTYSPGLTD